MLLRGLSQKGKDNMIYIKKFDYSGLTRGERKKAETANGRLLLKQAVQAAYNLNSDTLKIALGEHGKPFFFDKPKLQFNISHSGDYVAVMVGDKALGVDIQIIRPVKKRLTEKLCNEGEREYVYGSVDKDRAFIKLWTLKESYIKAIGTGMSFPMDSINFNLSGLNDISYGKISNQSGIYFTYDYGEFILSACVLEDSSAYNDLEDIFRTFTV